MGLWERLHKDAQDTGPSVADALSLARRGRQEIWGRPSRCPECGGFGYLDRIDIVDRLMEEHCTECFHAWTVSEADTVRAI